MSVTNEQVVEGTGTEVSITGVTAGNAILILYTGSDDGTPSVSSISSDQDSNGTLVFNAGSTGLINHSSPESNIGIVGAAYWLNASGGDHTITLSGTDITFDRATVYEISTDGSGLELADSASNEESSATAHSCGSVTSTAAALFAAISQYNPGAAETEETGYTKDLDGSREIGQSKVESAGATNTATWDSNVSVKSLNCHVVIQETTGGGSASSNAELSQLKRQRQHASLLHF